VIFGGGVAVCLLLSAHRVVIFAIAQLSCITEDCSSRTHKQLQLYYYNLMHCYDLCSFATDPVRHDTARPGASRHRTSPLCNAMHMEMEISRVKAAMAAPYRTAARHGDAPSGAVPLANSSETNSDRRSAYYYRFSQPRDHL